MAKPRAEIAARFDGTGYVSADGVSFPGPPFTLCFWMRWGDVSPGGDLSPSGAVPHTASLLSYNATDDGDQSGMSLWFYDATALTIYLGGSSLETGVAVDDGAWHHIALTVAVKDATHYDLALYHNASLAKQGTVYFDEGQTLPTGRTLTIGERFAGNRRDSFSGQILLFAVIEHLIDPSAMSGLMGQSDPQSDGGIFWPLDALPPGARDHNVSYWSTKIELPKPGHHIIRVDTSAASNRRATVLGAGSPALGAMFTPGSYTIDIDGLGTIDVVIDLNEVRLNGQSWTGEGDLTIVVQEDGYLAASDGGADSYLNVRLTPPTDVPPSSFGVSSRSVIVEDYPLGADGSPDYSTTHEVYRTTIRFPHGVEWIDVRSDPAVDVVIDGTTEQLDPVHPTRMTPNELSYVVVCAAAEAVGTARIHLRTSQMPEDDQITICPDVAVHRKINDLAPTAFADHHEALGIDLSKHGPASCNAVQSAVRNVSLAVEHTVNQGGTATFHDKRVNPRRMDHTHWMLDLTGGTHSFSALETTAVHDQLGEVGKTVRIDQHAAAGFLDDVGHFFTGAAKVMVHTAKSVVNDVADTTDSIWTDTTRTAEKVGDDLVHGDLTGSLMDLTTGVADVAGDAGRGVRSLAGDVAEGAQDMVVVTIQLAENLATDACQAVQFVLDHTGIVGEAIKGLLHAVELAVEKVIGWLADKLGWGDILVTQKALAELFTTEIAKTPDQVQQMKKVLHDGLESIRTWLDTSLHADTAASFGNASSAHQARVTAPKHNGAIERVEWFLSKLTGGSTPPPEGPAGAAGGEPEPVSTAIDQMAGAVGDLAGDPQLVAALDAFVATIGEILHDPFSALDQLKTAFLTLIDAVGNLLIDEFEALIDLMFDLLTQLLTALDSVMTAAVPVPLVSGLFSAITQGETLTVINLVSLIVAIPTTLIAKAVEGVAPFAQGATAGQAKLTTHRRNLMYAYGSVQIVDGFVSAGLDFQYKKLLTKLHESKKRVPQIQRLGRRPMDRQPTPVRRVGELDVR